MSRLSARHQRLASSTPAQEAAWIVIVRCPLCGSWIEGGGLSLHQELTHSGDEPSTWGFIRTTDAMITSKWPRAGGRAAT